MEVRGIDFGERLCEIRKQHGYTQEQLAGLIGVAKSTVTGYEKGYREPNIATIKKLARAFSISIDELLGFEYLWFPSRTTGEGEAKLLNSYRELNQQGKKYILQTMEMVFDAHKQNNCLTDAKTTAELSDDEILTQAKVVGESAKRYAEKEFIREKRPGLLASTSENSELNPNKKSGSA